MILPSMDYMDSLIVGAAKIKSCKLQKLQNRALRLIRMTKEPGLPMLGINMLHSEYAVQFLETRKYEHLLRCTVVCTT